MARHKHTHGKSQTQRDRARARLVKYEVSIFLGTHGESVKVEMDGVDADHAINRAKRAFIAKLTGDVMTARATALASQHLAAKPLSLAQPVSTPTTPFDDLNGVPREPVEPYGQKTPCEPGCIGDHAGWEPCDVDSDLLPDPDGSNELPVPQEFTKGPIGHPAYADTDPVQVAFARSGGPQSAIKGPVHVLNFRGELDAHPAGKLAWCGMKPQFRHDVMQRLPYAAVTCTACRAAVAANQPRSRS